MDKWELEFRRVKFEMPYRRAGGGGVERQHALRAWR